MKRRKFIAGLGSAVAWPVVARTQQGGMPVIGYLSIETGKERTEEFSAAFLQALTEQGYFEGRNLAIEYRSSGSQYDQWLAI